MKTHIEPINSVSKKVTVTFDEKICEEANTTILNFINIIMHYAPIGIGCYFASLVGTFGKEIALGYGKTFIIYTVVAVLFYFIFYITTKIPLIKKERIY